jgi:hypothetical protein
VISVFLHRSYTLVGFDICISEQDQPKNRKLLQYSVLCGVPERDYGIVLENTVKI